MSLRRQWSIVSLSLLVLAIFAGYDVYTRLIAPAAPLNFDEAAHSLPGYYMLRDARNLDLRAFWGDFHIQTLWPPMFSMLQAPFLAVLGRSDDAARLFAYLMLVAALFMGCAVAQQIDRRLAPLAGLISGLLALSAPGWLFVSSWAMQETPVAFMVFVVFWSWLRAYNTQRIAWHAATGVALFALFLTKYNYAAFAFAAIGVVDVWERVRQWVTESRAPSSEFRAGAIGYARLTRDPGLKARDLLVSLLALHLPFTLGLLMWFFTGTDIAPTATKWRDFAFFVSNESSGYAFWSVDNLLYYARAAAGWLMPHVLLLAGCIAAAVVALRRVRHPGVALLALFFGLGFVLATLHQLKAPRYITPIFPALWLLAGLGIAAWAIDLTRARLAVVLAFALTFASWAYWLPRLKPVWAGHLADDMRAASEQIVRWQDGARPVLIIGTFGELSPPLFEWRLRPLPAFANNPAIQYDAPPRDAKNDIERVQLWLNDNPGAQVTLIALDKDSPLYNTDDMRNKNAWRQDIVARFGEVRGVRKIDERDFPQSGITISFWLSSPQSRIPSPESLVTYQSRLRLATRDPGLGTRDGE